MKLPATSAPCYADKNSTWNCRRCFCRLETLKSRCHCDVCGEVFCIECCSKEAPLAHKGMKDGRVCDNCFNEEFAYIHVLVIWLQYIGIIIPNCMACGLEFTFWKKKYGCLMCQQTLCDRCIPLESTDKADVVHKCRRCQMRIQATSENKTILRMEEEMKNIFIKLIFLVADRLDIHNKRINMAETGLSSVGLLSGALAIIGFGLSFATFGASLGLTVAGGVIGGASGVGQISAHVTRMLIKNKSWQTLKIICKHIQELKEKRWQMEMASTVRRAHGVIGSIASASKASVRLANLGDDVTSVGQVVGTAGKLADKTANASKTLFSSLSPGGKALHFGGIVFAVAGVGFDIYTIIDRSCQLYKDKPTEVAETMRRLAYRLMGPMPHLPSMCERRVVERELALQRALN